MTEVRTPVMPGCLAYAVGDIHGRSDLLDRLLQQITDDATQSHHRRRILLFLGDYIDRGSDSRAVIERLCTGLPSGFEAYFLKGNHEALMLGYLDRPGELEIWLCNGGEATLSSYGVATTRGPCAGSEAAAACRDALLSHMPSDHLDFLNALALSVTLGDYFFVHAGVRPGIPLDRQQDHDLIWIRDEFLSSSQDFGKVIVHGHTPVREPEVHPNRINVDTGAWMTGRLTALRLEGATTRFLATVPE